MKLKLLLASLVSVCVVAAALAPQRAAHAYPQPSLSSPAWQFSFTHGRPAAINVRMPDGGNRWFWYLPYKVQNNTGEERMFIPDVTIATDAGDIRTVSNKEVPLAVFDAIKRKLGNRLLENPMQVVGRLLQGEDQARESVIIWPAFEHDVDLIHIFIGGLSGETQVIQHPVTEENVTVRKTLMLTYQFPGTGTAVRDQAVVGKGEEWVMR